MNSETFQFFRANCLEKLNSGKLESFDELWQQMEIDDSKAKMWAHNWYQQVYHLAHLQSLLEQENIAEILLHSPSVVQLDQGEKLEVISLSPLSDADYQLALEILALKNNISWNYATPFASFFVSLREHLFRATLTHFSISPAQISKLFLRRIGKTFFPLESFHLPSSIQNFLQKAIATQKNIIISGATSSGKTALLKTLLNQISPFEHLIILEDTHEIKLEHPTVTNLLADEFNSQKSLADYCAYALRMRPNRIILGEIRSREIVPFIISMNTGHRGLMSTVHANSALNALHRLALLFSLYAQGQQLHYATVIKLICDNIDYVIHMNNRRIEEIIHVVGAEDGTPFFEVEYHQ